MKSFSEKLQKEKNCKKKKKWLKAKPLSIPTFGCGTLEGDSVKEIEKQSWLGGIN